MSPTFTSGMLDGALWDAAVAEPADPDYDPRLDTLDWDTEWSRYAVARRHATEDEMREARALARSNLPPDPVEAILGHRADHVEGDDTQVDRVLLEAGWPIVVQHNPLVVRFKADIDPFVDAWRDIVNVWRMLPIVNEPRPFLTITDA